MKCFNPSIPYESKKRYWLAVLCLEYSTSVVLAYQLHLYLQLWMDIFRHLWSWRHDWWICSCKLKGNTPTKLFKRSSSSIFLKACSIWKFDIPPIFLTEQVGILYFFLALPCASLTTRSAISEFSARFIVLFFIFDAPNLKMFGVLSIPLFISFFNNVRS